MSTQTEKHCNNLVRNHGITDFYDLNTKDRSKILALYWGDNIEIDGHETWCENIDVSEIISGYHKQIYDERILASILIEKTTSYAIQQLNKLFTQLHEEKLYEETYNKE